MAELKYNKDELIAIRLNFVLPNVDVISSKVKRFIEYKE